MTPLVWIVTALGYVGALSSLTFAVFAWDKRQAGRPGAWRVAERHLLWLAAAGGTPGALLGQRALRHKSYKQPFGTRLRLIALAQGALIAGLGLWLAMGARL